MHDNNENLLAVAWWVILNSPDLLQGYIALWYSSIYINQEILMFL